MGIQVVWDDAARTIIRWDFDPEWTWDDFHAAFQREAELSASVGYRVDVIPDTTRSNIANMGMLTEFRRIASKSPPNTGLIVITGGNRFANTIIQTFKRVYRIAHWKTAATLDEARRIIQADRAKQAE